MGSLLQDVRFALRQFLRAPTFTLAALFALALGTGANAAIFSVVYPVLFRPLPFPDAHELVAVVPYHQTTGEESNASYPELLDWRQQATSFDGLAAFTQESVAVGAPHEAVRVWALFSTANLPSLLAVQPLLGRSLGDSDEEPTSAPVAVLGEWMWRKHFASDSQIAGKSVQLNGKTFTIAGVLPDFQFPGLGRSPGIWAPLQTSSHPEFLKNRGHHHLTTIARLKDGVHLKTAAADMSAVASRLKELYPGDYGKKISLKLVELDVRATSESRPIAFLLLGAVVLVLLIACANVANLLLARATSRQREFAIRLSLGASRWRIVRQLLTESVLLSLIGASLGLLISLWITDSLKALADRRMEVISLNVPMLGFTLVLAVLTGVAFGLLPALTASRVELHEALKEAGTRVTLSKRRALLQKLLIGSQIALAFALLAGAGLMVTSLVKVTQVDPGFESDGVVSMRLPLPDWSYSAEQKRAFYREMLTRLQALPGVLAVAAADPLPFHGGTSRTTIAGVGVPPPQPGEALNPHVYEISPEYFTAMGVPMLEGRTFSPEDRNPEVQRSIVINRRLAERLWPNESALGKRIVIGAGDDDPSLEVIGVVGNVRHKSLEADPPMQIYLPYEQSQWLNLTLVVKFRSAPESVFAALPRVVRDADPNLPAAEPEHMRTHIEEASANRRITMYLLGAFALLALVLASVGLYGLIAYTTSQRTHELAIRVALGAQPRQVIGLILRQGLSLTAAGLGLGLMLALALSQVLAGLVYGVPPTDPLIYACASVVLAAAALAATYGPARRATTVDPLIVLRAE